SIGINPNSVEAHLKYAEYLKLRGQLVQARQEIEKVLRKHKDSLAARELLALSYQEEGNVAKATQECYILQELVHGRVHAESLVTHGEPPMTGPVEATVQMPSWDRKPAPEPKPESKPAAETKPAEQPKPAPRVEPSKHQQKTESRMAMLS